MVLFEQQVSVYSADIICDLISGAATMSMIYSIQGQDQVIKVVYEPMKVKLMNQHWCTKSLNNLRFA